MRHVYVVIAEHGEYSDRSERPVMAFRQRQTAEAFRDACIDHIDSMQTCELCHYQTRFRPKPGWSHYTRWRDELNDPVAYEAWVNASPDPGLKDQAGPHANDIQTYRLEQVRWNSTR